MAAPHLSVLKDKLRCFIPDSTGVISEYVKTPAESKYNTREILVSGAGVA
jgi:hypothetical protein